MELITFNNCIDFIINQDELIIKLDNITQNKTIRITGDKYKNYIYPIYEEFKQPNSIDFLLNKLKSKIGFNIEDEEFYNIINNLLDKKILIRINPFNSYKNSLYNNRDNKTLNIIIFAIEDLNIILELISKLKLCINCYISIAYECQNEEIQNLAKKTLFDFDSNIKFYNKKDFILSLLSQFDLIIYYQANFDDYMSKPINKLCIKKNIALLIITICDRFSLIGPFYLGKNSLCLDCARKNEIIKSIMLSQNYIVSYYRKHRNFLYVQNLSNIITLHVCNYYYNRQSSIVNSVLYIDEKMNYCHKYRLVKFLECESCIGSMNKSN